MNVLGIRWKPGQLTILLLLFLFFSLPVHGEVNPRTGQLSLTEIDLVLPAGAITMELRRSLLPQNEVSGQLGTRWRSNWEKQLIQTGELAILEELPAVTPFWWDEGRQAHITADGQRIERQENGVWIRHKPDTSREIYDPQGRLVEMDFNNGNRIALEYGTNGRLSQATGPAGSFIRFITDDAGKLVRAQTSSGIELLYEYSGDRLSRIQLEGGPSVRYSYDADGFLTKTEQPGEGIVQYSYDPQGRVIKRRLADGSQERWEYEDQLRLQHRVDPAGSVTTTRWSKDRRREETTDPLGHTSVTEYDEVGRPVSITGPTGETMRIGYDPLGRIISATDPAGRSTRFEYLDDSELTKAVIRPDGSRLEYAYDEQHNLTGIRIGKQQLIGYSYTKEGQIASMEGFGIPRQTFSYHPDGHLKSITDNLGGKTRFEYDTRGNLVRETNPLGGITLYRYDAQNRLISETDPSGAETRYKYDTDDRLLSETGPDEAVTRYTYNSLGRLTQETDPAGRTTHYRYDSIGRLQRITSPDGQTESYSYNQAGNLTAVTDAHGKTSRFEYDPLGRLSRELYPDGFKVSYEYDAAGQLIAISDNSGGKRKFSYNSLGEVVQVMDSGNARTQYQYNPLRNLIGSTDPSGQRKRFGYTAGGQIIRVHEPSGDEARYTYDAANRLATVQRPSGGITRYDYDAMGNLIKETDPLGKQKRHQYDLAGRPIATVDAMGHISRTHYDQQGRVIKTESGDGTEVSYHYDRDGNLVAIDDGVFPIHYGYDATGQQNRVAYPALNRALTYQYHPNGQRSRLLLPDGQAIGYEYNDFRQLAAIVLPTGKTIKFSYYPGGGQKRIHYPNGISGHYQYDGEGRFTQILYQDKQGKVIAGSSYRLDALGNLAEYQDATGGSTRYTYDAAGQLVAESSDQSTIRYRYATGGNRSEVQRDGATIRYQHNTADQLTQAGSETFTYDTNGNLIIRRGSGDWRYHYSGQHQLVQASGPEGIEVNYYYDPAGTRVGREDASGQTWLLNDGFDLVQELDADLNTRATYIHAPGIDRPVAMLREGRNYYYHTDHLGSVRWLTDDQGRIVNAYNYDAFGSPRVFKEEVANPFTYTAREWDPVTGLYYFRARYYDPGLGRFIAPDPIPASLDSALNQNGYLYALNNPLRFTDPLGLSATASGFFRSDWSVSNLAQWNNEVLRMERGRLQQFISGRGPTPIYSSPQQFSNNVQALKNVEQVMRQRGILSSAKPTSTQATPGSALPAAEPGSRYSQTKALQAQKSGSHTARLGTQPVASKPPAGTQARTPWWKKARMPKSKLARAGAALSGLHLWACRREGKSWSECGWEFGIGLGVGMAVGAGATAAAATGTVAGTVVVIGVTAYGGISTVKRFIISSGTGNENRANQNQLASQQLLIKRHAEAMARFQGTLTALRAKGRALVSEFAQQQELTELTVKQIEKSAAEIASTLQTRQQQLTGTKAAQAGCKSAQKVRDGAVQAAAKSEQSARKAQQSLQTAESALQGQGCQSKAGVEQAQATFKAARNAALQASQQFTSAQKQAAELKQIQTEAKNALEIMLEIRAPYKILNEEALQGITTIIAGMENKTRGAFNSFEQARSNLMNQIRGYIRIAPPGLVGEYQALKSSASGVAPYKPPSFGPLAERADSATQQARNNARLLEGLGKPESEALMACLDINPPGDAVSAAAYELVGLENYAQRVKSISARVETCLASLKAKSRCTPDNWSLECEVLGSPMIQPTPEQRAKALKLAKKGIQGTTDPSTGGKGTSVSQIPGGYTEPGKVEKKPAAPSPASGRSGQQAGGEDPWESFLEPKVPGKPPSEHTALAQPPSQPSRQPPAEQPPVQPTAPSTPQTARWDLVQTISIPWHKKVKTMTLKKYTNYRFEFSGVMSPWPDQKDGMDAAYCYRVDERQKGCSELSTHSYLKINTGMYYGTSSYTANRTVEYNPQHVYTGIYAGQGVAAEVSFCCFNDPLFSHWAKKTGSLTLKIFEQNFQ